MEQIMVTELLETFALNDEGVVTEHLVVRERQL